MNFPILYEMRFQNDWSFIFYKDLILFLMLKGKLKEKVKQEISFWISFNKSFNIGISLEGVNYLLAIDDKKKKVRLVSYRASNEILILNQIKIEEQKNTFSLKDQMYHEFKEHIEEILKLKTFTTPSIISINQKKNNISDHFIDKSKEFEEDLKTKKKILLSYLDLYVPSLFERISDFALILISEYALFRIHLLKFIAVLPSLNFVNSEKEVKRMLLESFRRLHQDSKKARKLKLKGDKRSLPYIVDLCFHLILIIFTMTSNKILTVMIRFIVRLMAKRFIVGEEIQTSKKCFKKVLESHRDLTLDQLGEVVVSDREVLDYKNNILELIKGLEEYIPKGEKNDAGIYRAHISIKISALCYDIKPEAFDYTYLLLAPPLIEILTLAQKYCVFINIDAEHFVFRDIIFNIYKKVLLETPELKEYDQTGIVLQAYLRDSFSHFKEILELARARNLPMSIRLVKGAYWDNETIEASAHGYNAPQFLNKFETDKCFKLLVGEIFKSSPYLKLCIASHNYLDHIFSEVLREKEFSHIPLIEHQCLHMTYEALSVAMSKMGWTVRNYIPIGELIVGMAYLVRRVMENSSQVGILTMMRSHKKNDDLITATETSEGNTKYDENTTKINEDFVNVAPMRLFLDDEYKIFLEAFNNFTLGKNYNNNFLINGEEIEIKGSHDSKVLVGKIKFATLNDAERALDIIDKDFNEGKWSSYSLIQKQLIFSNVSQTILSRRNELATLIMYESGKTLYEALGDVDEAIDFINFYMREQGKVEKNKKTSPRGPCIIIAPWNFSFAIPCGMTVASLLAGNPAILKPAEQTPLIAMTFVDILHKAGVPTSSLINLPGVGEVIGKRLVEDSRIASILFTGSKKIGLEIYQNSISRFYSNKKIKKSYPVKIITEMGGKNTIIVTSNADLDESIVAILYSSFAHAGQKCSACSRLIIDNKIKEKVIKRLKEATLNLKLGSPIDFSTYINPLINKNEKKRLMIDVENACLEAEEFNGKVILNRSKEASIENCVGPVIIELPFKRAFAKNSYSQKELFAPVLHLVGFDDLKDGVDLCNSTDYALTGGVFSQSQDDIEYCLKYLECGNIYVNRIITGARVGIEPFGGLKMSGTGPKAGGFDYVKALSFLSIDDDNKFKKVYFDEKNEGNDIELAEVNNFSFEVLNNIILNSLSFMIGHSEQLFINNFHNNTLFLQELRKFVREDFLKLKNKKRNNKKIKGQLSYSTFDLSVDKALFIFLGIRSSREIFIGLIFSILSGTGTTIFCTNKKVFIWWNYLINILYNNGIERKNLKCYLVNLKEIEKIKSENIDVLALDGDTEYIQKITALLLKKDNLLKMTRVITNHEGIEMFGHIDFLKLFSYEKSFAINIMRHGVSMEIEF